MTRYYARHDTPESTREQRGQSRGRLCIDTTKRRRANRMNDSRLRDGLLALGLSIETVDQFLAVVQRTKARIKSEGMITRKAKPAAVTAPRAQRGQGSAQIASQTLGKLKPARTLRVSYNGPQPRSGQPSPQARLLERLGGQPAGIPITDRIAELERELEYSDHLTDWQRSRLRRQIRELGALGNTATGQASATASTIAGRQAAWGRNPSRKAAQ